MLSSHRQPEQLELFPSAAYRTTIVPERNQSLLPDADDADPVRRAVAGARVGSDRLTCLACGKSKKTLKRHLAVATT